MRTHLYRAGLIGALAVSISPFACATAQAQTTSGSDATVADASASEEEDQSGLGEIVVTAQRREESAQSVPISLQSFSTKDLASTGTRSTDDLLNVVGGLVIISGTGRVAPFVRGVGSNSSSTTPSVLTFIDGVYQPYGYSTDLMNLQSVEVLKGPQGTLFGRNATGGVIQLTTRAPSETPSVSAQLGYGNYETVDASAYVTAGLAPGVAADFAVRYSDQGQGFGINVFNGDDVNYTDRVSIRSRLRAELSEAVTFTVAGDYSKVEGTVGANISPVVGGCLALAGVAGVPSSAGSTAPGAVAGTQRCVGSAYFPTNYDYNAGPFTPFYRSSKWGVSGTLEASFSGLTARSITAYQRAKENVYNDFDGTPAPITNTFITRSPRVTFTQELQLFSDVGGPLQWTIGAFYYNASNHIPNYQLGANTVISTAKSDSISGYGQASYELVSNTKLTLGARYTTIEKSSIEGLVLASGVLRPGSQGSDSQKFKELTWRAALDHNLTDNALIYASVSRGFNAGFFNVSSFGGFATRTQNPPVLPEFITAYEVGAKTDLFDRHLRVNLSGYIYKFKNLAQSVYTSGSVSTINAAVADIKGIDLEIVARPVRSLTLSLNGSYIDGKYGSYANAPNYVMLPTSEVILPIGAQAFDAAGRTIVNAPEITYTFTASHVLETAIGNFETTGNLSYRGKTYVDPGNRFPLPTRYVFNLTERWTATDSSLFVEVWAKNLFDERYDNGVAIVVPLGLVGSPAPPRTYGATVGFNF